MLGRLVRAGPVPVHFAPAGFFFGDFARAVSQPAHFGRAGRVGAFAWAGEVLGHFLQPAPGHFPQPVPGRYFAQPVQGHRFLIENNRANPTLETIEAIAACLSVRFIDLFDARQTRP